MMEFSQENHGVSRLKIESAKNILAFGQENDVRRRLLSRYRPLRISDSGRHKIQSKYYAEGCHYECYDRYYEAPHLSMTEFCNVFI